MYKFKSRQISFTDFNTPIGMKLNPDNRWVKKAEMIPWDEIEQRYASFSLIEMGMLQSHFVLHSERVLYKLNMVFPMKKLHCKFRKQHIFNFSAVIRNIMMKSFRLIRH